MAFMLGAFTSGLAGGAKNAMSLYSDYEDIKSKKDLSDSLQSAMSDDAAKRKAAPGTAPGQATGFLGNAQSDSAASAPKSNVDLNADPRMRTAGRALGAFGSAMSDSAMSAPGTSPFGNAKSDSAMSAPQPPQPQQPQSGVETVSNPQFAPGRSTSPSNMTTYDQPGAPQSSVYNSAPSSGSSIFGSRVTDWLLGRNPQNRAVHVTPTMGIQTGPGPSSTPMSTSPGGQPTPPQYLPPQRPQALASAPVQGAPTLANPQGNPLQAIATQTQYGGM